jgi:predicted ArsR family transcriptional regulator
MKTMIYSVHHDGDLTSEEQELLTAVGTGISAADLSKAVSLSRQVLYRHLDSLKQKGNVKIEMVYAQVPA